MRICLIIAAVIGMSAPAAIAAPTKAGADNTPNQPAPDPGPARDAALRLARIVLPERDQVAAALRMVDSDLAPAFRGNDDFKALEADFPGFTDTVLAELKPALARFTRRELPAYHARVAELFASRLDTAEIDDLAAFYQTPTGQKMIRGMHENLTARATVGEVMTDPDKPTSYSAIAKDHQDAAEVTTKLIDRSDEPALLEFAKKPYFTRLAALGPALRKLEQDFTNEPSPQFEAEVEAIIKATIAKFEAQTN